MTVKTVYRFKRANGGVTVSPVKPEGEYEELFRLIAEEGFELYDGNGRYCCIDTEQPENYTEVREE